MSFPFSGGEASKRDDQDCGRIAELSDRVKRTIDRMDKVFEEFLYASKAPSDEREDVILNATIKDCIAMLEPRAKEAGVALAVELPDEDVAVSLYEASLCRALMNIVTNAQQHSPEGGTVTVTLVQHDKHVSINVVDQGDGFKESELDHMFEMFVSTRPSGTGLGLFLARTAMERCGGTIEARNLPDKGACFSIVIPRPGSPSKVD